MPKFQTAFDLTPMPPFLVHAGGKPLDDSLINLASNESPFGPSPRVLAALEQRQTRLNRYPDMGSIELRTAIADHFNLEADRIVCGNGGDTLIHGLAVAYASPGCEIVYSEYAFIMFRRAALAVNATSVVVPEENHTFSVDNALAAVSDKTRILYLANPNNPTGSYLNADELLRLREGLADHVILMIDDAYVEYAEGLGAPNALDLARDRDDIVVLRTFSKVYGLAALRLGWVYAPAEIAENLNRVRLPFTINGMAQAAGVAALEDTYHTDMVLAHTHDWLPRLSGSLAGLGLEPLPSVGNFVTVRFPNPKKSAELAQAYLQSHNIIPRTTADYGMPEFLRITVGLDEENQALISALENFLNG